MKKLTLAFLFLLCLASNAGAQFPIASVASSEGDVKLKWVGQTDSSVVVYATYIRPEIADAPGKVTLSRKTSVTSDDMDYKLVNSSRIPIFDEAMSAATILDKDGQKVNFMMEFEKFPIDEPFDIVAEDTLSCMFSFKDIRVDMAGGTRKANTDRFLNSTPVLYMGRYGYDGDIYSFYYDDGFFIASTCSYSYEYLTLTMEICNDSDHGVMFSTGNVNATSHVKKGKNLKEVKLNILSKYAYENVVEESDYSNARQEGGGEALSIVGSEARSAAIPFKYGSWENIGLRVLSSVMEETRHQMTKPYMEELDKTRSARMSGYLQSQSLGKGESCNGWLKIERVRNMQDFDIVVTINNRDYKFHYVF